MGVTVVRNLLLNTIRLFDYDQSSVSSRCFVKFLSTVYFYNKPEFNFYGCHLLIRFRIRFNHSTITIILLQGAAAGIYFFEFEFVKFCR